VLLGGVPYTIQALQQFNTCHNPDYFTALAISGALKTAHPELLKQAGYSAAT